MMFAYILALSILSTAVGMSLSTLEPSRKQSSLFSGNVFLSQNTKTRMLILSAHAAHAPKSYVNQLSQNSFPVTDENTSRLKLFTRNVLLKRNGKCLCISRQSPFEDFAASVSSETTEPDLRSIDLLAAKLFVTSSSFCANDHLFAQNVHHTCTFLSTKHQPEENKMLLEMLDQQNSTLLDRVNNSLSVVIIDSHQSEKTTSSSSIISPKPEKPASNGTDSPNKRQEINSVVDVTRAIVNDAIVSRRPESETGLPLRQPTQNVTRSLSPILTDKKSERHTHFSSSETCRQVLVVNYIRSAGCETAIVRTPACRGTCISRVVPEWHMEVQQLRHVSHCTCCKPHRLTFRHVRLNCTRPEFRQVQAVGGATECACRPCSDANPDAQQPYDY